MGQSHDRSVFIVQPDLVQDVPLPRFIFMRPAQALGQFYLHKLAQGLVAAGYAVQDQQPVFRAVLLDVSVVLSVATADQVLVVASIRKVPFADVAGLLPDLQGVEQLAHAGHLGYAGEKQLAEKLLQRVRQSEELAVLLMLADVGLVPVLFVPLPENDFAVGENVEDLFPIKVKGNTTFIEMY